MNWNNRMKELVYSLVQQTRLESGFLRLIDALRTALRATVDPKLRKTLAIFTLMPSSHRVVILRSNHYIYCECDLMNLEV